MATVTLSSSPNDDSMGSFSLDLGGGICAHAEGGGVAQTGCVGGTAARDGDGKPKKEEG